MVELYNLLLTLGLPVSYNHFTSPPALPYLVYLMVDSDNFGADNKAYYKAENYQVELYSKSKDITSETLIEALFDMNDIYYKKTETYIDSEELYQVLYEIQM